MKKFLFGILFLLCLVSCSNNDINEIPQSVYYVKYVWNASYAHYGYPIIVSCKNNTGEFFTKSYSESFIKDEMICGPFIYGYKVEMNITNASEVTLEICISKDNSPFILKTISSDKRELEYTIDF